MTATDVLAALPQPSAATDFLKQNSDMLAQQRQAASAESQEMQGPIGQAQNLINQPRPQPPQLASAPEAKNTLKEDITGWVAAASLLAGIAGTATRQHVTAALGAFGAFGQGFNKGQLEAADQAHKQWGEANDKIIEDNRAKLDAYSAAIEDRKAGIDEQMQQVQLIAVKYKDPIMADAAVARNFTLVANLIERQEQAQNNLQQHYDALNGRWEQFKQTFEAKYGDFATASQRLQMAGQVYKQTYPNGKQQNGQPAPSFDQFFQQWSQQNPNGGGAGGLSQSDLDSIAEQRSYGDTAVMNLGWSAGMRAQIEVKAQKMAASRGSSLAAEDLKFRSASAGASVVGRTAGSVAVGAAEIPQLVPKIMEVSRRLDLSQFPSVNSIELAALRGTGSADVVTLASYIQTLRNAYQQIAARGGRMTDTVRKYGEDLISGNMPTDQLAAAANAMVTEGGIVRGATGAAMNDITSGIGGAATAAPPGAGGSAPPPGAGGWSIKPAP